MNSLRWAAQHAARGLPVFRLKHGTKNVFIDKNWAEDDGATCDPGEIFDRFRGGHYNIGINTTGFVGLDFDKKSGGLISLEKLRPILVTTYMQKSANDGVHAIYKAPDGFHAQTNAGKFAPGVDVRGFHGYLVGAGSEVDGRAYEVLCDAPVAPAPEQLIELLQRTKEKDHNAGRVIGELDKPIAVECAIRYLASTTPAIQGEKGDDRTIVVANYVLDLGISVSRCADLMWEFWNPRCQPPWDYDELVQKVINAARSRRGAIGCAPPGAEFEPVILPAQGQLFLPASRWRGATPAQTPFVIGTYVPRDYVTIVGAAGGRGKSSLALQMMACVASGSDFLGCPVIRGTAAGLFCEDTDSELHKRTAAICAKLGIDLEAIGDRLLPTSYISSTPVLWKEKSGRTELLTRVEHTVATIPDLRLLVIDGAADTFAANENDRTEVSKFMSELNALAARFGVAIVLVMHESKTTADDDVFAFSGSTAWFNKCRSAIKICPLEDHDDKRRLLHLKCNVGRKAGSAVCSFEGFGYTRLADDDDRAAECFQVTRALMVQGVAAGENLSPNKRASNFAGRWLEKNQIVTDFHKDEFTAQLRDPTKLGLAIQIYSKSGGRTSQRFVLLPAGDGSVTVTVGDSR